MITISLCMIVKNESAVLTRCLDSIADLVDEIIIVDTGSTDNTKEIAFQYTDKVYDFEWTMDFSAARNFSFSKATMEYIYAADADELLNDINREQFRVLKQALLPEIEIVQMKYVTRSGGDIVLNSHKEYRPKLYKRLRSFVWIDPIHETVRLDPIVYDSDVEIWHLPQNTHGARDFSIFVHAFQHNHTLSDSNIKMYAKELLKAGTKQDYENAEAIFASFLDRESGSEVWNAAICILARKSRLCHETSPFFTSALKGMLANPSSEICYELGMYYTDQHLYQEAILWFSNAVYETSPQLDIHTGGDLSLNGLITCYTALLADSPSADFAPIWRKALAKSQNELANWKLPEEI